MSKLLRRYIAIGSLIILLVYACIYFRMRKSNEKLEEQMKEQAALSPEQPPPPAAPVETLQPKGKRSAKVFELSETFSKYVDSVKEVCTQTQAPPQPAAIEELAYTMYGACNAMLANMTDDAKIKEMRKRPPFTYGMPNEVKKLFHKASLNQAIKQLDRLKTDCKNLEKEVVASIRTE